MKFRFSLRSLLLFILAFAVVMSAVVMPRLKRYRLIARIDKEPIVWMLTGRNIDLLDRLMGIDGAIATISCNGNGEKQDLLSRELLEAVSSFSPLYHLSVEYLRVEPCSNYPRAEYITIRNVAGRQAGEWLHGLLAVQNHTREIWIENTPSFADEHFELLGCAKGIESIEITQASISGVGIRGLSDNDHKVKLSIENCPITDDGLRAIAECVKVESLLLSFTFGDRDALPDFRLLLLASSSLDLTLTLNSEYVEDHELTRTIKELDDHFGYSVVIPVKYKDRKRCQERMALD
jgi:hypothetical protein